MKKYLLAACLAGAAFAGAPAQAGTALDPMGDFLPSYTGPHLADLDVTKLNVYYDSVSSVFHLKAKVAGAIDPSTVGFYVFGVNTGTGPSHPFGALGQPDVKFNQVFFVQKNGTGNIGATSLTSHISIMGDVFSVDLPLSLLPSTGFTPMQYGFNLWPRGNGAQAISDFAPENRMLTAVPELGTWAMMIAGLAAVGGRNRMRRRSPAFA